MQEIKEILAIKEIKKISDNEFRIQDNKISIIDNNTIFIEAIGEQTDEIASASIRFQKILANRFSGNLNFLISLDKSGKHSSGARKIWREMSDLKNTGKVALFGIHPVARLLASFVIGGRHYKNIRFFNTREAAESWLNE